MDAAWGIGCAIALIGGGLCCWVWRARQSGKTRETAAGYLIGDQIAGGTGQSHHSDHHHHSSGGDWSDGGGADGGAGA
jgi:hypothetical protein